MDPNEPRLPAPPDGRSPADLTKKELVAHLVAAEAIPQWKLNVMTRDAIVALFDMPRDGALAAIDAAGLAHGRYGRCVVSGGVCGGAVGNGREWAV